MSLGTQITATLSKLKSINIKLSARVCFFIMQAEERETYKKLLAQTNVKKVSTVIFIHGLRGMLRSFFSDVASKKNTSVIGSETQMSFKLEKSFAPRQE